MKRTSLCLSLLVVSLLLLAACTGAGAPAVVDDNATSSEGVQAPVADDEAEDEEMSAKMSDESLDDEVMGVENMDDEAVSDESMGDEAMDGEGVDEHETSGEDMEETMEGDSIEDESVYDEAAAGVALAAWQQLPLTDAVTGATFTLSDFAGQTIFVEPMATWCTNCRQQLISVRSAQAQLSGEEVVFVALSVETNLEPADLQRYANDNGFGWTFAVATPELLQALVGQFGRTITNPPSTPHFIVRPDGSATELATGAKGPDEIIAALQDGGS